MDRIEKFFEKNKDQFGYIDAKPNDWDAINKRLEGAKPHRAPRLRFMRAAAASIALILGWSVYYFWPEPVAENMEALIGLNLGNQFPEVALQNPDGEKVSLSDLNARVVLVDFWASYSMACNEANCYYFKPLYNEFKDQGFEIYAVSADSSASSWIHAIQRDQLDWVQVSDLKGFDESPVFDQFAVDSLPTNYLLDKEGKIIAINVNVNDLETTLSEVLAYQ